MKQLSLLIILSFLALSAASAQMTQFKALFLFNFAKNIDWPADAPQDNFIITVIGNEELGAELKNLAKIRRVGSKTLKIKEANNANEIEESHLIYLSSSKSSLMPIVKSYQKDNPVLLVADNQGLCAQGAGISFYTAEGKLKYEISPDNISAHGLKTSQKLISLGNQVQ